MNSILDNVQDKTANRLKVDAILFGDDKGSKMIRFEINALFASGRLMNARNYLCDGGLYLF